jgi:Na+-transporting NADH:ubiquinone oxidoreductase subunit NqrD
MNKDNLLDIEIVAIFAVFTMLTLFSKEPYQLYVSGIGIGLGIGLALVHWIIPFVREICIGNKIMQEVNR